MGKEFKPYNGTMDFASILSQITEQKDAAAELAARALAGQVDEEEASVKIEEIKKASVSLRAVVVVFIESHKDCTHKEKKTLSEAIKTLDDMSNKFKIQVR